MRFRWLWLVAFTAWGQTPGFPFYTADSIANSAALIAGFYAPNTFLSIYGNNLADTTLALQSGDVQGGTLPVALGGVRVYLNSQQTNVYYVSPHQVNILIPTIFAAGTMTLQVLNGSKAGPAIQVVLGESAPGMFGDVGTYVLATHVDYSRVTVESPARPGEVIVLWGSGLGPTIPLTPPSRIPSMAARLSHEGEFEVLLNGVSIPHANLLYAGVTPTVAGLFQVNLRLPDDAPADPEIRIGTPDRLSPAGRYLRVR